MREYKRTNIEVEGNAASKCDWEKLEKCVSEVTKERDSDDICVEYLQHKHGEHWESMCVEAKNVFECCMPRIIKCVAGISMHSERNMKIDKCNITVVFPTCLRMKIGIMLLHVSRIRTTERNRKNI